VITGMNSDVRYEGAVFHVQTEDLGLESRELVSVVFVSGRVLRSVRKNYRDLDAPAPSAIRDRLMDQHRTVIQAILRGRLSAGAPAAPAAEEVLPSLVVTPLVDPRAGEHVSLLLLLRDERSFGPLADADLDVAFAEGSDGEPRPVHRGRTDSKGFHLAEFKLPEAEGADLSLMVQGSSHGEVVRATVPVLSSGLDWRQPPRRLQDRPRLVVSDLGDPQAGETASLMVLLRAEPSCQPIADATVRLLFVEGDQPPREIHRAATDAKGFHLAEVSLPDCQASEASLILEAESPLGPAETVIPVVTS
jgi:hypothetical protein